MPPPQKKSILKNVVASVYTSYKAYIFASIWPNLKFKCLPERVERIRTLEMKDSSINLKALNRAGGPVERFRALRFTVACTSSKLNCIKYQNHFFSPFPPPSYSTHLWVSRRRTQRKGRKRIYQSLKQILHSVQIHITVNFTLKVGSNQ